MNLRGLSILKKLNHKKPLPYKSHQSYKQWFINDMLQNVRKLDRVALLVNVLFVVVWATLGASKTSQNLYILNLTFYMSVTFKRFIQHNMEVIFFGGKTKVLEHSHY